MTCTSPLRAYSISGVVTEKGKKKIFFGAIPENLKDQAEELFIPCGKCMACRINYSRQWAVRCVAETFEHKENYFVTLTYDDDNLYYLPDDGNKDRKIRYPSCRMDDVSEFIKRVRADQDENYGITGAKFLAATEYGTSSLRPHAHLAMFGFHIPIDGMEFWNVNDYGDVLYRSTYLEKFWKKGQIIVGDVTAWSAQYIAKYSTKNTDKNNELYEFMNVEKPKLRMSRRPGIGVNWFEKHANDILNTGVVYMNGDRYPIPKSWLTIAENRLDDTWDLLDNYYDNKEKMMSAMKSARAHFSDKDILFQYNEMSKSRDDFVDRENFKIRR